MKKIISREVTLCDYCLENDKEVDAIGVTQPLGKDVCEKHYNAFMKEIRNPEEFGGDMSGLKVCVDKGYKPQLEVTFKEK